MCTVIFNVVCHGVLYMLIQYVFFKVYFNLLLICDVVIYFFDFMLFNKSVYTLGNLTDCNRVYFLECDVLLIFIPLSVYVLFLHIIYTGI